MRTGHDGHSAAATKPLVVVVSGLPRAGTSLVMQMLAAGGLSPLSDGTRGADASNPRGYLEWEPIKRIREHPERIQEAYGRAVKVVSALLPALPDGPRYRVLFVERDVRELQASQRTMLARRGAPVDALTEADLARHVERTRDWLAGRPGFATCRVAHRDLLERPHDAVRAICAFLAPELAPLGIALDAGAMAAAVDPTLWRERSGSPPARATAPVPIRLPREPQEGG